MTSKNATPEKIEHFRKFWLNISETVQQIFTKLMSVLGNHITKFEIKRLDIGHS